MVFLTSPTFHLCVSNFLRKHSKIYLLYVNRACPSASCPASTFNACPLLPSPRLEIRIKHDLLSLSTLAYGLLSLSYHHHHQHHDHPTKQIPSSVCLYYLVSCFLFISMNWNRRDNRLLSKDYIMWHVKQSMTTARSTCATFNCPTNKTGVIVVQK